MSTIEVETRLHPLKRQNRVLILLLLALAGIGLIAATDHAGYDPIFVSSVSLW
jgi:DMSO reductase anchor subunit